MKKIAVNILIISLFALTNVVCAQRIIPPSDELKIEGMVKTVLKFTLKDLEQFTTQPIKDLEIVNHNGEFKGVAKQLRGFPLKNLLDKIEFAVEKPKELNEYYLCLVATDGYKVVFSWNEIFNTEIGDQIFIITEKEGKKLAETDERILAVSASDLKIGRRYIKGLSTIKVNKTD